ncbi:MAG TPA: polysaccharide pyruvyl transferase CsaB [Firmicutes bacterium]|nr:polysaccharide pyruvyl transferase CsaB [Candidatus Fermentithermobacillaceae bacterium]
MTNILLSGYYGFSNTGDEAILASTVNALRNARPDLNIMVLSKRPGETERTYGVRAFPRMNVVEVARAVSRAGLVVFGGGSLLQDATSLRSLIYYLSIIELSHWLGKPVVVYANGIGPISSRIGRTLTKHTLSNVKAITVRDIESKSELRNIGVLSEVHVTADPAFLLNPSPNHIVDSILEDHGISVSQGIVWVSMRHVNSPAWFQQQLVEVIAWLRQEGFNPCFFAMQERDLKIADSLNRKLTSAGQKPMGAVSNVSPEDALGALGRGEFCLGMRLHTLILSARVQVPFMGIEIDPKIGAFCRSAGCPVLPRPAIEPNFNIQDEFTSLMRNKDKLRQLLHRKLPEFRSLAQENIDMVLGHLG